MCLEAAELFAKRVDLQSWQLNDYYPFSRRITSGMKARRSDSKAKWSDSQIHPETMGKRMGVFNTSGVSTSPLGAQQLLSNPFLMCLSWGGEDSSHLAAPSPKPKPVSFSVVRLRRVAWQWSKHVQVSKNSTSSERLPSSRFVCNPLKSGPPR